MTTTTTAAGNRLDLSRLLLAHAAMRREYGRLADALESSSGPGHRRLVEDQIELTLDHERHHHADEDTWLWPRLRARAPRWVPLIDCLEEQHERIDPEIRVARDRSRPVPVRAAALRRLDELLNTHLDDVERIAVPLVQQHIAPGEHAAHAREVVATLERGRLALLLGWHCANGTPQLCAPAIASHPLVVRVLFRLVWWPRYRRRHERLYGAAPRRHPDRP